MFVGFLALFFSVMQFFSSHCAELGFAQQGRYDAYCDMYQRRQNEDLVKKYVVAGWVIERVEQEMPFFPAQGIVPVLSPGSAEDSHVLGQESKWRYNALVLRRLLERDMPRIAQAAQDNIPLAKGYARFSINTLAGIQPLDEAQSEQWVTLSERLIEWSTHLQSCEEFLASCI